MTTHDDGEQGNSQIEDIEANLSIEGEETPEERDKDLGDEKPEVNEAEAGDTEPEGDEPTQEEIEEILEALEAPTKWDNRYKEVFNEWGQHENGRAWQEAILEQYKESQGYTTQVEQERSDYLKSRDEFQGYINGWNEVLSPYNQMFTDTGQPPDAFVRQGLGLLQQLRADPAGAIRRLARDADVDLTSLQIEQQYEDPSSKKIRELEQRLRRGEQEQQAAQQRQAQDAVDRSREANRERINSFAEEVDASGNLTHPHLETVMQTMAEMIQGREAQRNHNQELPRLELQEAYDRACRLDPNLAQADADAAAKKTLAEKNAKAKKAVGAAKRVTGGKSGQNVQKLTLKEEIRQNIRKQANG